MNPCHMLSILPDTQMTGLADITTAQKVDSILRGLPLTLTWTLILSPWSDTPWS
jgi:hypothetical protein